jgi:hypothetical protein
MQSENFLAFRQFGLNVQAHRMYFKYKGLLEIFFWYMTSAVYCIELKSSQLIINPSPPQNESAFNHSDHFDSNSLDRRSSMLVNLMIECKFIMQYSSF